MEQQKIRIGKITKPHGLKGEFKVYPYTSDILEFKKYKNVYLQDSSQYTIEYVKNMNSIFIVKFKQINKIDDLGKLIGKYIFIDYKDKRKMQEDEYLISELIGLEVYEDEEFIGIVEDVLQYGANDVFVVSCTGEKKMIPNVKQFIKNINITSKKMKVKLIEGM